LPIMKKKYLIIIFIIFIVSTAVRYWPVFHKGFSYNITFENLILARNLSLTGEYKIDNEKNVILSSETIKEKGIESKIGNKGVSILYSKVFDFFGFNQKIPLYVSLFLYGIVSVLLFLLVLKLFNIWVALIFGFIDIFSPLVLQHSITAGFYEWGILFLTIALLIYLWKEKPNLIKLFLVGLFLALASLARNSFAIIPIVFVVYDFWNNKSIKRAAIFILPILIVGIAYLGPDLVKKGTIENYYANYFYVVNSQETTNDYLHVFPDSYTWYFERDAYIKSVEGTTNYDYIQYFSQYGYPVSLKNKILMYWASIKSYPKGLFVQTTIGGPFLIFLLVLGGFYLNEKNKKLLRLFVLWTGFLYMFLIIAKSNHWGHFISLQLPLFLLISLGIYWIIGLILKQNIRLRFKYLLVFGFVFVLFIHLVQSDKWVFHENYLYTNVEQILALVDSVEKAKDTMDKKTDVIAVGFQTQAATVINWYTDFSSVYFDSETVKKLLKEKKLQWAFDQFGVTKVIGYDKELSEEMVKATNAEAISDFRGF